ncbi:uncharacterized protein [Macrobrachium rosenbergii]|uniref:uncharacterized protein isoform X2 n=1 Tax=Macrobrachium rosenbergii TaxID=79674 RepID=UPI0034D4ACD1
MTEGIRKVSLKEEYVKVLESYSYLYEERPVSIHKDETLLVIRRSNDDWWQVVRPGEKRSFFAPAQHLKVITIPQEQMKQTIKQGLSLQKIQGSEENVPLSRPQGLVLPSQDSKSFLPLTDMQSPSASLSSHSYLTKIEMSRIAVERTDLYPSRSTSTSSFKSESPLVPTRGLSPRNGNADLISRGLVQQVSQESSSSHTSKSSLNDGSRCSMESLTLSHIRKQFMKAASHDELSSDHCRSSLDISQPRAASNEELDSRNSGRDYLFRSNQLSYRHRSNSVDFRIFQKDLSFSELKQGSLDKSRKPRLSKDPGNRRRSWAVEELVAENSRSAFKKGDTKDVSIVLDVPPKLPPKLRKHKPTDKVSLSSESIGKLEGPVDVKLQEVKCGKPPPPLTAPNVKRLSHEYDKGGTLQDSDSSDISGKQHRGLLGRPDGQDLKEVPVALPRKNLPPQLSSFEGKFDVQRSQSGGNILMSQSFSLGEVITRDSNGNQVKGERREGNFEHNSSEYGSLREKGFSDSDEKRKVKKSDSFGRVPGTPDLLRKMDRTPDSMRKVYVSKETYMGCSNSDPSFKISSKASEDRGEEKENEDIFPSRETPTPDSSRAGKLAYQFPPSPKISPQRALFDEWGEYYDETTKRQFYYNKKTREKRWKPPRKVVHSVSIPEVPPFSRSDRFDFGQNQAQTPIPDYPSSPKSLHRLRHNQYEGVLLPPNRSYTLGSSSNHSLHNTEASSHTLPAASSVSPNKTGAHPQLGHTVSLLTTPPAPPASAKPPHVPATPTTPTSPDFPDYSEDDQKYALLEVVLKLSPPRGWTKKYDAYTQTVYFYSKTKGERSKEAVCTTEVDIANLKNKQYIRRSYQNTMEFTKERQLEADVVDFTAVNIEEDVEKAKRGGKTNDGKPKLHGAVEQLALNTLTSQDLGDTSRVQRIFTEEKEMKTDKCDNIVPRTPPEKPPRNIKEEVSIDKGAEFVAISIPRSPGQESKHLRNHGDTSPGRSALSRYSTFSPQSSTLSTKGHSRSRSETIKASQLPLCTDSSSSPKNHQKDSTSTSKKAEKDRHSNQNNRKDHSSSSTSKYMPQERSLHKSYQSSRAPMKETSIFYSDRESDSVVEPNNDRAVTISGKPPSSNKRCHTQPVVLTSTLTVDNTFPRRKRDNHRKEKKGAGDSALSSKTENVPVSGNENGKPCPDDKHVEISEELLPDGRKSPVPMGPYNRMLRELSFHSIMKKKSANNSKETDPIPSSSFYRTDSSSSQLSDVSTSSIKESKRNLSAPNSLQVPCVKFTPSGEIPIPENAMKPKCEVRKSTFFTHEEDDSLLEYKPLVCKGGSPKHDFLEDPEVQSLSPSSPSSDVFCETHSDQEGSMWFAKSTEGGKIYFYEESGSKSQWKLPEHEDIDDSLDGKEACNRPLSPENRRISLLGENLSELIENTKKEGFLHRTFIMREGKKCRKNWTHSYVRYIPVHFRSGASGVLHFSKTKDEDKKAEVFEFHDICHLEHTNDKKTSRQQVLGLRNGRDTEVLLQFDDKDIADEWFKVLQQHEGVTYDDTPAPEEKKGKKTGDKVKRESSVDLLNDNKGITDKLRSFIKRRPQRELLEKKGIYKEAVFGSTLAELASQDKTGTPLFVLQCIKNIEKCDENLRTDGLYRISGNAAQIQKIRYEIAQRNYTVLSREKDVHNLSGALKLFFRELKEPLIPFANYDDFIQATDFELRRMNQQVEKLSKAVRKLPSENYETLKVLLQHLLRVTEFESDNRMSISNLAIVFGPCLLWRKVTTSNDLMTDVMLHNRVIEGLLTDFSRIFHAKR